MRYHLLHLSLVIVIILNMIGGGWAADTTKPNIVLIISDDQAWTDYGFMGHPEIQTPHIDRLAKEGVWFPRAYVPTPLCRPSLMTIVTGYYAHQHRVTGNDPSRTRYLGEAKDRANRRLENFIDNFETLPTALAKQGYLSFQTGKWWEGDYRNGGFTHGMTTKGRHGGPGLTIGRKGMQPIYDFVDMAIDKEKPFFIWYAPFLPHTPHTPPERILKKYRKPGRDLRLAKYYAMCEWFDETCGQLVSFIEERQLRDNTIFAYVCDNGWIQRTDDTKLPPDYSKKFSFAPRSKQTPYEGGIRTPIFFNWPSHYPSAKRQESVTSLDLYPTLLSLAGGKADDAQPGVNLVPYLTGKSLKRDTLYGEGFAHDITDLDDSEKSLLSRWCIEGHWKLILCYRGENVFYGSAHQYPGPFQLFDLAKDPHETHNLATQHPEIVNRLRKKIEAWWSAPNAKLLPSL